MEKGAIRKVIADIRNTMVDFENCDDPETTTEEWLDTFYALSCRCLNELEIIEESE